MEYACSCDQTQIRIWNTRLLCEGKVIKNGGDAHTVKVKKNLEYEDIYKIFRAAVRMPPVFPRQLKPDCRYSVVLVTISNLVLTVGFFIE